MVPVNFGDTVVMEPFWEKPVHTVTVSEGFLDILHIDYRTLKRKRIATNEIRETCTFNRMEKGTERCPHYCPQE
jgi:hypothetical protein